jgi:hypothetical protein
LKSSRGSVKKTFKLNLDLSTSNASQKNNEKNIKKPIEKKSLYNKKKNNYKEYEQRFPTTPSSTKNTKHPNDINSPKKGSLLNHLKKKTFLESKYTKNSYYIKFFFRKRTKNY